MILQFLQDSISQNPGLQAPSLGSGELIKLPNRCLFESCDFEFMIFTFLTSPSGEETKSPKQ